MSARVASRCHVPALLALLAVTPGPGAAGAPAPVTGAGTGVPVQGTGPADPALDRPLTLDDCIAIALRKNLALKIAEAEVRRAQGLHTASFAPFVPTVTAAASRQRDEARVRSTDSSGAVAETRTVTVQQSFAGGVSQQLPVGTRLDVTGGVGPEETSPLRTRSRGLAATVTQPLLRGAGLGVTLAGVRGTGYDRRARELDLADLRRQTAFGVKVAYYNVLRDQELLEVNRAALLADSQLVQASDAMVEAKVASRRDILSARIRFSDDVTNVVIAERDEQLSLDLLKDVMGIPLDAAVALADTALDARVVPLDEASLIRKVIETHPAVASAELAVRRSRLDLTVARNARLPRIDLTASLLSSFDSGVDPFSETRGRGWVAGLTTGYPLFDRAAAGAAVEREALLSQAQDRLELLVRQLTLRVRDIVRTVRTSAGELRAIEQTIETADQKLQFATAMFNLGRASNLDITDARASLVKARTQLVKKRADYSSQLALLESLTGEPVPR